jgi:glycerol kinase
VRPTGSPTRAAPSSASRRGSSVAHIARAALESIAFQSAALLQAMSRDLGDDGKGVSELRVDGGACVNNLLMQFQADLLGIPVVRPKVIETTALGAAYLAGLSCGVYAGLEELAAHWQAERTFHPTCRASAPRTDAALGTRGGADDAVTRRPPWRRLLLSFRAGLRGFPGS